MLFLRLGVTAFGGPAAHIAMMENEVVTRRRWVTHERFLDMLGAANLIPGPSSSELAVFIGYDQAGLLGLLVAGVCFVLPAALMTAGIAWAYVRYGALPHVGSVFYGIKPVIIAIVAQALWGLTPKAVRGSRFLGALTVVALGAALAGADSVAVLLGRDLAHGDGVEQLRLGKPVEPLDQLGTEERDQHVAAAHHHRAKLEKGQEERSQRHGSHCRRGACSRRDGDGAELPRQRAAAPSAGGHRGQATPQQHRHAVGPGQGRPQGEHGERPEEPGSAHRLGSQPPQRLQHDGDDHRLDAVEERACLRQGRVFPVDPGQPGSEQGGREHEADAGGEQPGEARQVVADEDGHLAQLGPGMRFAAPTMSRKRSPLSQRRRTTTSLSMSAMCADGPPKAVRPRRRNSLATSPRPGRGRLSASSAGRPLAVGGVGSTAYMPGRLGCSGSGGGAAGPPATACSSAAPSRATRCAPRPGTCASSAASFGARSQRSCRQCPGSTACSSTFRRAASALRQVLSRCSHALRACTTSRGGRGGDTKNAWCSCGGIRSAASPRCSAANNSGAMAAARPRPRPGMACTPASVVGRFSAS